MKRYLVKWLEQHEEEIIAENEDQAWDMVDIDCNKKTYHHCSIMATEEISHPGDDFDSPDSMSTSHYQKENS